MDIQKERPGSKPKEKVKIRWSANFAYAIGLLVTDGSLSKDGRHTDFTSKDIEQIKHFLSCLQISAFVGTRLAKIRGHISTQVKKEKRNDFYQLRYSKYEAMRLVDKIYHAPGITKLTRKYLKIQESLAIV